MDQLLTKEIINVVFQTLLGSSLPIAAFLGKKCFTFYKSRNLRKFWSSFQKGSLNIVVTEYPVTGDDELDNIAKVASSGWLISKGMALSLASLLDFCKNKLSKNSKVNVCGDRTSQVENDNLIILGSPANNPFSKDYFLRLCDLYDLPYRIEYSTKDTAIKVVTDCGAVFEPDRDGETILDYAIVTKAQYQTIPEKKSVIIIAGCYMWGTQASAQAITNINFINKISELTNDAENVSFVIRARSTMNSTPNVELLINNKSYVKELRERNVPIDNH